MKIYKNIKKNISNAEQEQLPVNVKKVNFRNWLINMIQQKKEKNTFLSFEKRYLDNVIDTVRLINELIANGFLKTWTNDDVIAFCNAYYKMTPTQKELLYVFLKKYVKFTESFTKNINLNGVTFKDLDTTLSSVEKEALFLKAISKQTSSFSTNATPFNVNVENKAKYLYETFRNREETSFVILDDYIDEIKEMFVDDSELYNALIDRIDYYNRPGEIAETDLEIYEDFQTTNLESYDSSLDISIIDEFMATWDLTTPTILNAKYNHLQLPTNLIEFFEQNGLLFDKIIYFWMMNKHMLNHKIAKTTDDYLKTDPMLQNFLKIYEQSIGKITKIVRDAAHEDYTMLTEGTVQSAQNMYPAIRNFANFQDYFIIFFDRLIYNSFLAPSNIWNMDYYGDPRYNDIFHMYVMAEKAYNYIPAVSKITGEKLLHVFKDKNWIDTISYQKYLQVVRNEQFLLREREEILENVLLYFNQYRESLKNQRIVYWMDECTHRKVDSNVDLYFDVSKSPLSIFNEGDLPEYFQNITWLDTLVRSESWWVERLISQLTQYVDVSDCDSYVYGWWVVGSGAICLCLIEHIIVRWLPMRFYIVCVFVLFYLKAMETYNKNAAPITIYFRYAYVTFWGIFIQGYILLFSDKIFTDPLDDDDEELDDDDEKMDGVSSYEITYSPFIENDYFDKKVAHYFYKNRLSFVHVDKNIGPIKVEKSLFDTFIKRPSVGAAAEIHSFLGKPFTSLNPKFHNYFFNKKDNDILIQKEISDYFSIQQNATESLIVQHSNIAQEQDLLSHREMSRDYHKYFPKSNIAKDFIIMTFGDKKFGNYLLYKSVQNNVLKKPVNTFGRLVAIQLEVQIELYILKMYVDSFIAIFVHIMKSRTSLYFLYLSDLINTVYISIYSLYVQIISFIYKYYLKFVDILFYLYEIFLNLISFFVICFKFIFNIDRDLVYNSEFFIFISYTFKNWSIMLQNALNDIVTYFIARYWNSYWEEYAQYLKAKEFYFKCLQWRKILLNDFNQFYANFMKFIHPLNFVDTLRSYKKINDFDLFYGLRIIALDIYLRGHSIWSKDFLKQNLIPWKSNYTPTTFVFGQDPSWYHKLPYSKYFFKTPLKTEFIQNNVTIKRVLFNKKADVLNALNPDAHLWHLLDLRFNVRTFPIQKGELHDILLEVNSLRLAREKLVENENNRHNLDGLNYMVYELYLWFSSVTFPIIKYFRLIANAPYPYESFSHMFIDYFTTWLSNRYKHVSFIREGDVPLKIDPSIQKKMDLFHLIEREMISTRDEKSWFFYIIKHPGYAPVEGQEKFSFISSIHNERFIVLSTLAKRYDLSLFKNRKYIYHLNEKDPAKIFILRENVNPLLLKDNDRIIIDYFLDWRPLKDILYTWFLYIQDFILYLLQPSRIINDSFYYLEGFFEKILCCIKQIKNLCLWIKNFIIELYKNFILFIQEANLLVLTEDTVFLKYLLYPFIYFLKFYYYFLASIFNFIILLHENNYNIFKVVFLYFLKGLELFVDFILTIYNFCLYKILLFLGDVLDVLYLIIHYIKICIYPILEILKYFKADHTLNQILHFFKNLENFSQTFTNYVNEFYDLNINKKTYKEPEYLNIKVRQKSLYEEFIYELAAWIDINVDYWVGKNHLNKNNSISNFKEYYIEKDAFDLWQKNVPYFENNVIKRFRMKHPTKDRIINIYHNLNSSQKTLNDLGLFDKTLHNVTLIDIYYGTNIAQLYKLSQKYVKQQEMLLGIYKYPKFEDFRFKIWFTMPDFVFELPHLNIFDTIKNTFWDYFYYFKIYIWVPIFKATFILETLIYFLRVISYILMNYKFFPEYFLYYWQFILHYFDIFVSFLTSYIPYYFKKYYGLSWENIDLNFFKDHFIYFIFNIPSYNWLNKYNIYSGLENAFNTLYIQYDFNKRLKKNNSYIEGCISVWTDFYFKVWKNRFVKKNLTLAEALYLDIKKDFIIYFNSYFRRNFYWKYEEHLKILKNDMKITFNKNFVLEVYTLYLLELLKFALNFLIWDILWYSFNVCCVYLGKSIYLFFVTTPCRVFTSLYSLFINLDRNIFKFLYNIFAVVFVDYFNNLYTKSYLYIFKGIFMLFYNSIKYTFLWYIEHFNVLYKIDILLIVSTFFNQIPIAYENRTLTKHLYKGISQILHNVSFKGLFYIFTEFLSGTYTGIFYFIYRAFDSYVEIISINIFLPLRQIWLIYNMDVHVLNFYNQFWLYYQFYMRELKIRYLLLDSMFKYENLTKDFIYFYKEEDYLQSIFIKIFCYMINSKIFICEIFNAIFTFFYLTIIWGVQDILHIFWPFSKEQTFFNLLKYLISNFFETLFLSHVVFTNLGSYFYTFIHTFFEALWNFIKYTCICILKLMGEICIFLHNVFAETVVHLFLLQYVYNFFNKYAYFLNFISTKVINFITIVYEMKNYDALYNFLIKCYMYFLDVMYFLTKTFWWEYYIFVYLFDKIQPLLNWIRYNFTVHGRFYFGIRQESNRFLPNFLTEESKDTLRRISRNITGDWNSGATLKFRIYDIWTTINAFYDYLDYVENLNLPLEVERSLLVDYCEFMYYLTFWHLIGFRDGTRHPQRFEEKEIAKVYEKFIDKLDDEDFFGTNEKKIAFSKLNDLLDFEYHANIYAGWSQEHYDGSGELISGAVYFYDYLYDVATIDYEWRSYSLLYNTYDMLNNRLMDQYVTDFLSYGVYWEYIAYYYTGDLWEYDFTILEYLYEQTETDNAYEFFAFNQKIYNFYKSAYGDTLAKLYYHFPGQSLYIVDKNLNLNERSSWIYKFINKTEPRALSQLNYINRLQDFTFHNYYRGMENFIFYSSYQRYDIPQDSETFTDYYSGIFFPKHVDEFYNIDNAFKYGTMTFPDMQNMLGFYLEHVMETIRDRELERIGIDLFEYNDDDLNSTYMHEWFNESSGLDFGFRITMWPFSNIYDYELMSYLFPVLPEFNAWLSDEVKEDWEDFSFYTRFYWNFREWKYLDYTRQFLDDDYFIGLSDAWDDGIIFARSEITLVERPQSVLDLDWIESLLDTFQILTKSSSSYYFKLHNRTWEPAEDFDDDREEGYLRTPEDYSIEALHYAVDKAVDAKPQLKRKWYFWWRLETPEEVKARVIDVSKEPKVFYDEDYQKIIPLRYDGFGKEVPNYGYIDSEDLAHIAYFSVDATYWALTDVFAKLLTFKSYNIPSPYVHALEYFEMMNYRMRYKPFCYKYWVFYEQEELVASSTNFMGMENMVTFYDAPEEWQFGFQDPASPIMEGIIDLHHDLVFFMILISFGVIWVLFNIIFHFFSIQDFFNLKYFNYDIVMFYNKLIKFAQLLISTWVYVFKLPANAALDFILKQVQFVIKSIMSFDSFKQNTYNYYKSSNINIAFLKMQSTVINFWNFNNASFSLLSDTLFNLLNKNLLKFKFNYNILALWKFVTQNQNGFFSNLYSYLTSENSFFRVFAYTRNLSIEKSKKYQLDTINLLSSKEFNPVFPSKQHKEMLISLEDSYEAEHINKLSNTLLVWFPKLFTHHTMIEVVWTIIPAIILILIALPSFSLLFSMDQIWQPFFTIKVIGNQWYWSYEYC